MRFVLTHDQGIPGDGAGGYGVGFEGNGGRNVPNDTGCGFIGSFDGSGSSIWLEGLSNDDVHHDNGYDATPVLDLGLFFELHGKSLQASVMLATLLPLVRRPTDAIRKAARTAQRSAWPLE
jgi:hypothetical protein